MSPWGHLTCCHFPSHVFPAYWQLALKPRLYWNLFLFLERLSQRSCCVLPLMFPSGRIYLSESLQITFLRPSHFTTLRYIPECFHHSSEHTWPLINTSSYQLELFSVHILPLDCKIFHLSDHAFTIFVSSVSNIGYCILQGMIIWDEKMGCMHIMLNTFFKCDQC